MSRRINFGIDLGTTNSAIGRFKDGQVEIIRNPAGLRQLLPSVVALRGDRVIVGEKAREWMRREPSQVFSAFKRKMGTTHSFLLANGKTYSPEDLSAYVLQELKQFLPAAEQPEAAVITIPASFDTVQAQATLRAGFLAGFSQVKLLQEPIAASLAYANQGKSDELKEGQWLVFDLGGGTFDVALVRIHNGEMTVVDHEGDNFLGGTDVDLSIVMTVIVPELLRCGSFQDLEAELRADRGSRKGLLQKLLLLAEEAKIELSGREETDIELDIEDDEGTKLDLVITLTKSHLVPLLEPLMKRSTKQVSEMMQRNNLAAKDLRTILLVGGTTYIPYVREQLSTRLGIPVSTEVDPTAAVAIGAAFYAGSQLLDEKPQAAQPASDSSGGPRVRVGYQKVSRDLEEFLVAEIEEASQVAFFRITRADGGFDTGLLPYQEKIRQYLPLLPATQNAFSLRLFDAAQQELVADVPLIEITQGQYSLQGQPLPLDICVEVDDLERNATRLEVVFPRNTLLPVRKTITRQVSRSIAKDSGDSLTIKLLEGDGKSLPSAAMPVGTIRLEGKQLQRDLVRGSDVEISLEMDESRSLKVEVYLMMADQTVEEVFVPEKRQVLIPVLREDLQRLLSRLRRELREAEERDQFDLARQLTDLEFDLLDLVDGSRALQEEDITDARFQVEDRSRKMAAELHLMVKDQELLRVQEAYFAQKRLLEHVIQEFQANVDDQKAAKELMAEEKLTLASAAPLKIRLFTERLQNLAFQIRWRSAKYIRNLYLNLKLIPLDQYSHPDKALSLFQQGDQAFEENQDQQLRIVLNQLFDMLPRNAMTEEGFLGTGLG